MEPWESTGRSRGNFRVMLSKVRLLLKCALFGVYVNCVYYSVTVYLVTYTVCYGTSMRPVLNKDGDGDVAIVDVLSKYLNRLKRNDVVIARQPNEPGNIIGKRITAVAGEEVATRNGDRLWVPRGHVWLEGCDPSSHDSRDFGPVPLGLLEGRIVYRVWPLHRFGKVK